ncbi:MAG: DUF4124 domain-containing protein, partial [Gammaproteobacteria bacterium]
MLSLIRLLIILLPLFLVPAEAKKLYKYQDDKGHWHFTDKPPRNQKDVEVKDLEIRQHKVGQKREHQQ